MTDVVIVSAVRTPIGNFGGSFKSLSAVQLGETCAKAAIERAGITPEKIDQVFLGNILNAGLGQNVARQVAVNAGIPVETPAMTINLVCGSGLKTVAMAAQTIRAGEADFVLCGGTESMSNAPYVMDSNRWGARMGHGTVKDTMLCDGLTDVFNGYHMGITAENIAEQWNLSREEQDVFAAASQNKAEAARKEGRFADEIVPVAVPQPRKDDLIVDQDEFIREGATAQGLGKLRPAFKKDGTVTAGNASGINDGAAMLVVTHREKAEELGLEILAAIKADHTAGVDPSIMGYGPVPATKGALKKAGWTVADLDLIEANEAFAAQALSVAKDLELDPEKVNVNGGAIALGHPIGASGARVLVTLVHEMIKRDAKKGAATLCIGGGMGTSLLVER